MTIPLIWSVFLNFFAEGSIFLKTSVKMPLLPLVSRCESSGLASERVLHEWSGMHALPEHTICAWAGAMATLARHHDVGGLRRLAGCLTPEERQLVAGHSCTRTPDPSLLAALRHSPDCRPDARFATVQFLLSACGSDAGQGGHDLMTPLHQALRLDSLPLVRLLLLYNAPWCEFWYPTLPLPLMTAARGDFSLMQAFRCTLGVDPTPCCLRPDWRAVAARGHALHGHGQEVKNRHLVAKDAELEAAMLDLYSSFLVDTSGQDRGRLAQGVTWLLRAADVRGGVMDGGARLSPSKEETELLRDDVEVTDATQLMELRHDADVMCRQSSLRLRRLLPHPSALFLALVARATWHRKAGDSFQCLHFVQEASRTFTSNPKVPGKDWALLPPGTAKDFATSAVWCWEEERDLQAEMVGPTAAAFLDVAASVLEWSPESELWQGSCLDLMEAVWRRKEAGGLRGFRRAVKDLLQAESCLPTRPGCAKLLTLAIQAAARSPRPRLHAISVLLECGADAGAGVDCALTSSFKSLGCQADVLRVLSAKSDPRGPLKASLDCRSWVLHDRKRSFRGTRKWK